MNQKQLHNLVLGFADNVLILGQRLGELCGHGPSLETDIACTNIALDLIGQSRTFYQYASKLSEDSKTEDDLAFLRLERAYKNVLLVEQPNTHFGYVMARQFFFDAFHLLWLEALKLSKDNTLAAIAEKAILEVKYHKRFSSDWVKRLGDGTPESATKMQEAIDALWPYTKEFFIATPIETMAAAKGIAPKLEALEASYYKTVNAVLNEAQLKVPEITYFQKGGKEGIHSEHMGYLLAEMQYMQRTYPGLEW